MNNVTLYLTQEEIDNIFLKLPKEKQSSWKDKMVIESIDAFETEEELTQRMTNVRTDDIPGMKEFVEGFRETMEQGDLSKISLKGIPEVAMLRHFYAIGACGLSALIGIILQDPELNDEAFQAAADFSVLRHAVLEANASAVPA